MEVKLLNAFMLQLNTIIQLLALFKLILYSNLSTIITEFNKSTCDLVVFNFLNFLLNKCSTLFYIRQH